ncbi:MAG: hypothetical protein ACR2H2_10030 [Solirubrobacteraceae bacterium]
MKRLLALTSLSLAAVFMVTSLADGQSAPVQVPTQDVTSSTTPQRDRTRPLTFTTTGTVVPPPYCAVGASQKAGDCVPLLCAPGVTNTAYCVAPPIVLLCSGDVTVRFRRGTTTLSTRSVELQPDCTYRSRVTFRSRTLRQTTLRVSVRFEGNAFLFPASAPTHTVRIG